MLRYRGEGAAPEADVARFHGLDGAVVVEATGRMLLVEGGRPAITALVDELPDWVMAADTTYQLPDTRPAIDRPVQD